MEKPTFEQVVSEYHASIRRTLFKLGVGPHDVDDITQEVLRAIARGLPAFEPVHGVPPEAAMGAWLFAICERQAANHRRKMYRRAETPRDAAEIDRVACSAPTPEASYLVAERAARLHAILETMETGRRAVLVAHELQGVAIGEVASDLGIPVNTAWNRLRLARDAIRAAWEPRSHRKSLPRDGRKSLPRDGRKSLPRDGRKSLPRDGGQSLPRGCTMGAAWIDRQRSTHDNRRPAAGSPWTQRPRGSAPA